VGETFLGSFTPDSTQLESIHFVSSTVGFCSGPNTLYKSIDGGASWFLLFNPGGYIDDTGSVRAYSIWGSIFIDEMTGMVAGGDCVDHKQFFFKTTDGGQNWNLFTTYQQTSSSSDILLYPDSDTAYGVSSGIIWISDDQGDTWRLHSHTGQKDWHEEINVFGNTILVPYSIGCSGNGTGGGVRMSTDFGNNWIDYDTGADMYGTFLHDELRGWVCGSNEAIYYTSDGGENWILSNCGIENGDDLDDMVFVNDSLGWCVGDGIYKTHKYIPDPPEIIPPGPFNICPGDTIELSSNTDYKYYLWSNGERTKSIKVTEPGVYWLLTNNVKCDSTFSLNQVEIDFYQNNFSIINFDTTICEGDFVQLTASPGYSSYQWSTGSSTNNISTDKEGWYYASCVDSNGCYRLDSVYIAVAPLPKPRLEILDNFRCFGDSIWAVIEENDDALFLYNADTGEYKEVSGNTSIKNDGLYYIMAKSEYGCLGFSDSIRVTFRKDSNRIAFNYLDSEKEYYDFDSIPLLDVKCIDILFRNTGGDTEEIEDPFIFYNIFFSIPRGQFPIVIPPYESRTMTVCFSPDRFDDLRDTILLPDRCSPHIIPLLGNGRPENLIGEGPCGSVIEITTVGLQDFALYSSDPFPNPAYKRTELTAIVSVPKDKDFQLKGTIINMLGKPVAYAQFDFSSKPDGDSIVHSGDIIFETDHLESGTYLILLNFMGRTKAYPIIINK
jgi:photosystem II stability/assembly factor-like uncharacterized protein